MDILESELASTVNQVFDQVASKSFRSADIIDIAKLHGLNLTVIVNSRGETLLHRAAGYGRRKLVQYLIEQGANVNAQDIEGQGPLHYACNHAHNSIAKRLIDAGADVNLVDFQGWTPLCFSVVRRENADRITSAYWQVVELLLDRGADPHIKSNSGRTCLQRIRNDEQRKFVRLAHLTNQLGVCTNGDREKIINKYVRVKDFFELVREGELNPVRTLLTKKLLNSRLETCENITPLHRAAGYNHVEIAKLFIESGAEVNAKDDEGRIPLHNASKYGHIDMIELLVAARSDINTQDLEGFSPLHVAASNKTFTACLKLIELGANIQSRTIKGDRPYDLAESDDVREVLNPGTMMVLGDVIPSSSDYGIYVPYQENASESQEEPLQLDTSFSELMLDSSSKERLFSNTEHILKIKPLNRCDRKYQLVEKKMLETIVPHDNDSGGKFSGYEILKIDQILHEKVWSKYKLKCQLLEIDHGPGSKNERLLFHGSNFIGKIQKNGFDEGYAQRNGMFGAGLYFAAHSSKSNQYTFGWGQGCLEHSDKSCYKCERMMIYAQVALGKSLVSKEAIPDCAHAPPGYSSVTGLPNITDNLIYPEYVIYSGDQAYPLYVITYRITR